MDGRMGWVMQVSPLLVRFSGDTGDTAVALKDSGLTFSLNERVALAQFDGQWVVTGKPVAT